MHKNLPKQIPDWQTAKGLGTYSDLVVFWEEELQMCLWSTVWIIDNLKSIKHLLTCLLPVAVARLIHTVQHNSLSAKLVTPIWTLFISKRNNDVFAYSKDLVNASLKFQCVIASGSCLLI